jgi:hypothetical protein
MLAKHKLKMLLLFCHCFHFTLADRQIASILLFPHPNLFSSVACQLSCLFLVSSNTWLSLSSGLSHRLLSLNYNSNAISSHVLSIPAAHAWSDHCHCSCLVSLVFGRTNIGCKIWGFHSCDYEECHFLGCDAIWLFLVQLLVTTIVVPSSLLLSTLMMEVIHSSETSVLTRDAQCHIPEDSILLMIYVVTL